MNRFKHKRGLSLVIAVAILMTLGNSVYADETEVQETEVIEESVEAVETEAEVETEVFEEPEESEESQIPEVSEDYYYEVVEEDPVTIDFEYDNDYLAEQYIAEQMSLDPQVCLRSYDYTSHLGTYELLIFNEMRSGVVAIANGTRTSSEFSMQLATFTAEELGVSDLHDTDLVKLAVMSELGAPSTRTIVTALMNACPYEMYWFDKTQSFKASYSYNYNYSAGTVTVGFRLPLSVAGEYRGADEYTVDSRYGEGVRNAAANARSIIDAYAPLDDYDKLAGYCDYICQQTEYNDTAAHDDSYPYGNPWQMIWVFDGDPSTTVVCEGYSKAFQFLCDNSVFQSNSIYVFSVTGNLSFPSGNGGHMWNIVHMDDGKNYLVDVTNSDGSSNIFLRGMTGSVSSGYTLSEYGYYYRYDNDTKGCYTTADLTISSTDYSRSVPSDVAAWRAAVRMYWYSYADGRGYPMDSGSYGSNETVMEFTCKVTNAAYNQRPIYYSVYYTPTGSTADCVRLVHTNITPTGYRFGSSTDYFYECRCTNDAGFNTGYYIFIGGMNAAGCDINSNPSTRLFYQVATVTAGTVSMHRLYNPNSGEHFYTSNVDERNNLISLGWEYEGVGWTAPASSNTPVYRLYNRYGGEHHYTTNLGERNALIAAGWDDEGIGWYSDDAQTVPLYRQYNPNAFANNHNYTTSLGENDYLVSLGWEAEGIGWYGI